MRKGFTMRNISRVAAIVALAITLAAPAHADPDDPTNDTTNDTTKEVCGAFNLGLPPDQIAQGLQRNDGRFNRWRAWNSTIWPIIEGDCDS
jgi:hypothetical protein